MATHAADLDACLHDLGDVHDAFFESSRRAIEQQDRHAATNVRSRDARAHDTRTEHADALDIARLHLGVGDAGVLGQTLLHKEDGDEILCDGAAHQRSERLGLGL